MQLAKYTPPVPAQDVVYNIQHPHFPLTSRQGVVLTDVHESETEYTIISDLPGVLENDLNIHTEGPIDDCHIVIQTKRELNYNGIKHTLERVSGDFRRRIAIPPDADMDNVTATLSNGVLVIVLPKKLSIEMEEPPKKNIPVLLLK